MKAHEILVAPYLLPNGLELSVHRPPRVLLRELREIFPGTALATAPLAEAAGRLLVVPTNQHSAMEMVGHHGVNPSNIPWLLV